MSSRTIGLLLVLFSLTTPTRADEVTLNRASAFIEQVSTTQVLDRGALKAARAAPAPGSTAPSVAVPGGVDSEGAAPAASPAVEAVEAPAADPGPRVRKVAIFVKNRAGKQYDEQVAQLEDLISSRITDMGFAVIAREDAINAVSKFAGQGPNQGQAVRTEPDLDQVLSDSTSALRLTQNLGADYILTASMVSFGQNKRKFTGYGVETLNVESVLRVSYKLLDAVEAGSLTGGVVKATMMQRFDENSSSELELVNELIDAASVKLTEQLQQKVAANAIREAPEGDAKFVNVTISAGMQDLNVPDVVKNERGEWILTANTYKLEALGVTVEVNGTVVGSAPGVFEVPKGLNKLRLTREDFEPWERTVNFKDGAFMVVAMSLTERGRQKWLENMAIFEQLKKDRQLTDAEVEAIQGFAQMLRQSGFKVDVKRDARSDIRSDVNVNTTEGVKIEQKNQSLWQDVESGGVTVPVE